MQTTMLGPGFAVEVTGVDASAPVSEADAQELRELLDRRHLLILRQPGLDAAALRAFFALFGPIFDAGEKAGVSYVSNVVGNFPTGRLLFHQDFLFTPYPHRVQMLYAEEVQGPVAPTLFVSNLRAFERLSPEQREAWKGLHVVHARDGAKAGGPEDEFVRVELLKLPDGDDKRRYPRAVHPVLEKHPRTGADMLYVNEYYASHIPELSPEEGEQVIQEALALTYQPEGVYTHEWRLGDLMIWDNIALQHARSAVQSNTRRTLRRLLINDHGHVPGLREDAGLSYAPAR